MDPDAESLTVSVVTTLGVCGSWLFVWSIGGCAKKKKPEKPLESDFEKPPPLQMPSGGAGTQSQVSQVPETDKTKQKSTMKKSELKPEPSGANKMEPSGAKKESEAKKVESKAAPSTQKKEESVAKKSENPPPSADKKGKSQISKKSEDGKSDAKTDKKDEEKDDQYQQVDFGPGDLPPPPPPK